MNEKVWPKPAFFGPLVSLALLLVGLAWAVTRAIVSGPRGSNGGTSGNDDTAVANSMCRMCRSRSHLRLRQQICGRAQQRIVSHVR